MFFFLQDTWVREGQELYEYKGKTEDTVIHVAAKEVK